MRCRPSSPVTQVAGISIATALLVYKYAVDPRHPPRPRRATSRLQLAQKAPPPQVQMLSLASLGCTPGEPSLADVESQKQQQQQQRSREGGASAAGAAAAEAGPAADPSCNDHHHQQQSGMQQQQARPASGGGQGAAAIWHSARSVLAIRSFQIIVMQGVVGSMPWQAMVSPRLCVWVGGGGGWGGGGRERVRAL